MLRREMRVASPGKELFERRGVYSHRFTSWRNRRLTQTRVCDKMVWKKYGEVSVGGKYMEIWELVNERGEPSGVLYDRESGAEFPDGLYFRVVEVWVRVGERLLLTQRHPDKWCGLFWEVPGGGVVLGEEPKDSACRELMEETGIRVLPDEPIPLSVTHHGAAMVYSYFARLDREPELALQPTEVVDYKYLPLDEAEGAGELTPGTRERLEKFGAKLHSLFSEK